VTKAKSTTLDEVFEHVGLLKQYLEMVFHLAVSISGCHEFVAMDMVKVHLFVFRVGH